MLGRGLQRLQIEGSCGESSRSHSLYARELTLLQIPGWSEASEPMQAHGCEQQCKHALAPSAEEQPEPWANRSDFIDAALHEELIWMEAAAACDACAQVNNCKAHVAHCNSPCTLADGACCPVGSDADDWYTGDIEAEITKLEQQQQQQQALAEAQGVSQALRLQPPPVSSAHSE